MNKHPTIAVFLMLVVGLAVATWIISAWVLLFALPLVPGIGFLGMSDDERGLKKFYYLLLGLILSLIGGCGSLMCFSLVLQFFAGLR